MGISGINFQFEDNININITGVVAGTQSLIVLEHESECLGKRPSSSYLSNERSNEATLPPAALREETTN